MLSVIFSNGKSKWIIEAIEQFMQLANYPELVEIAGEMETMSDVVSIRLSEQMLEKLNEGVIAVRRQYPAMEGVKSGIIRASIIQRHLGAITSVTELVCNRLKNIRFLIIKSILNTRF